MTLMRAILVLLPGAAWLAACVNDGDGGSGDNRGVAYDCSVFPTGCNIAGNTSPKRAKRGPQPKSSR